MQREQHLHDLQWHENMNSLYTCGMKVDFVMASQNDSIAHNYLYRLWHNCIINNYYSNFSEMKKEKYTEEIKNLISTYGGMIVILWI